MSEQVAKPYLVRAIFEWCVDNALTPYLAVRVNPQTKVPPTAVRNGEIVLNISASATRKLTIDNDWVRFFARFNGVSQEVAVPMNAVFGIFARETGYGFSFTATDDPVASLAAATAPVVSETPALFDTMREAGTNKPRAKPRHLQVIK
jgi:stringent starvation protein B